MADEDDDDDEFFESPYEEGHWVWDDMIEGLNFISDRPQEEEETATIPFKVLAGSINFRDDIDVFEQLRFRKRYARKLEPGQANIITLQDVKDLVIFTAPVELLSYRLINLLHLPTTERLLRALILYCQYYLQVSDKIEFRTGELNTKVRTPDSEVVEAIYSQNLSDLRALVAKEYSIMLLGGADTKNFHHMGSEKKRSLSDRDARLIESFLRMCTQIVWIALERRGLNAIELEISRLFKTDIFNSVEHRIQTDYIAYMSNGERGVVHGKLERSVLFGLCAKCGHKLKATSPLINEIFCNHQIDYQMMGLGVIEYEELSPRTQYMLVALSCPEEELSANGVSCGILGFARSLFDTMLRVVIAAPAVTGKSTSKWRFYSSASVASRSSRKSVIAKSTSKIKKNVYTDIVLPPREEGELKLPHKFPDKLMKIKPCSDVQRLRWQVRLCRLLRSQKRKLKVHRVTAHGPHATATNAATRI